VDIVFTVSIFTYLYKYLYKGPDHTTFHIPTDNREPVDEIKDYVQGRYLSSHEAAWRILGFHIVSKTPSVTCLPVHLPDRNIPRFTGGVEREADSTSLLIRYFHRPSHSRFTDIKYCDYFKDYVLYKWDENNVLSDDAFLEVSIPRCARHTVRPRRVREKVTRLHMVSPIAGELFYLRCLLAHRPARSFRELRTTDSTTYDSFHEAAVHLGLFTNINEGEYAMMEANTSFVTPHQLRFLFSRIILEGWPAAPLWDQFSDALSADFFSRCHSHERGRDLALQSLGELVGEGGGSLAQYGLPLPRFRSAQVVVEIETYSQRTQELLEDAHARLATMNAEQRTAFNSIQLFVSEYTEHHLPASPLFLEGQPGRGKTFLVDALCSLLRAQNKIVLIVGSSTLAATLYEGGRTAHNLFQIPVTEVLLLPSLRSFSVYNVQSPRITSTSSPQLRRTPIARNSSKHLLS